jgi:hypothetical protein
MTVWIIDPFPVDPEFLDVPTLFGLRLFGQYLYATTPSLNDIWTQEPQQSAVWTPYAPNPSTVWVNTPQ